MSHPCPRCLTANPEAARYCRHCGIVLVAGPGGFLGAGHVAHPEPLPPPDGFAPFELGENLHFRWTSAWGKEMLLGSEPLSVTVFNGGYDLSEVTLRLRGTSESGAASFTATRKIAQWPRGAQIELEVSSWELTDVVSDVAVSLAAAEFGIER